jgi:V-type H+-transporting ATPase subunit a
MQAAKYELYRLYFKKERMIYNNLNKCHVMGNFIDGEVWIPQENFALVYDGIQAISHRNSSKLTASFTDPAETELMPPTYIKTNDLTAPFQEIVDTYGIPRYREINPALFAIVSFPFLFGVMFGDIGHGLLLLLFGAYLVSQKDEIIKQNSPFKALLKARYLLLLMGMFAFYSGWMYNDFLSIPLGVFGTCYENIEEKGIAEKRENCVYPFGLDPKWYVASNELAYFNSMKMKISVILGVLQMIGGLILKGMNAIYFNAPLDFIFEFIPQLIFMSSLFGYMLIMIMIKWTTDWSRDPSQAPSIITQLMNIFLKGGSVDGKPVWGLDNPQQQEGLHLWILIICGICVPLMLFPKPIITYMREQKNSNSRRGSISSQNFNRFVDDEHEHAEGEKVSHQKHSGGHGSHAFGEIFIHQAIETIEFVLGSISNTASYLRLWALSLAHAQLAKVFFHKTLLAPIQDGSIIGVSLHHN